MGLDHSFGMGGPRALFETIIFDHRTTTRGMTGRSCPKATDYREQYATYPQAVTGHAEAVEWARIERVLDTSDDSSAPARSRRPGDLAQRSGVQRFLLALAHRAAAALRARVRRSAGVRAAMRVLPPFPAAASRRAVQGQRPSGIREMLYRGAYRGEVTWGKLKKVRRKGTKHQQRRPESEWLTVSVPELRIVPEELWQRVKAQLEERAETFPRSRDGRKLIGRPRHQDESAYLLVGFTRCSMCGGLVGTETRRHGSGHWEQRRVVAHYACLDRKRRGKAICSNAVVIPQVALDRAVLRAVIDALNPDVLLRAVEVALAKLAHAREKYATRRAEVEQELGQVE